MHPAVVAAGPSAVDPGVDGNRDGNVRNQRRAGAAMDSQTLLLNLAEVGIRYA
jgi:hypothetical protein